MSFRVGHLPLSSNGCAWLAALCDPQLAGRGPKRPIAAHEVPVLIEAASAHGVLPAVARNIREVLPVPAALDAQPDLAGVLQGIDRHLVLVAGQCLLLRHHASRIATVIAERALEACVVKGPSFARRLYPNPAERSFTDIDILAAPSAVDAVSEALRGLGFVESGERGTNARELKWSLPGNEIILVELQTDLIHSSRLDIRLTYADLLAAGAGDPEDATALLLVAAVHGVAGHQFERLQPAVDLLQAVRGAAGPIDAARLVNVAAATGASTALQTGLDLVSTLFNAKEATGLADLVKPAPWRRIRKALLTAPVVLRSQANMAARDSWRRRAIREIVG